MDWIIVAYDNKNNCYINVTYDNCSKLKAIHNFRHEYPNCIVLNMIDL